jgi:glyoxylase I family protein
MKEQITTGQVHHAFLTVSDVARSRDFYTSLLGFQVAAEFGNRVLLSNGGVILGLGPAPNPSRAAKGERFDENRLGLDHLCLSVGGAAELEQATRILDQHRVSRGEIEDLPDFKVQVLMLRDPDNIQVELIAPYG